MRDPFLFHYRIKLNCLCPKSNIKQINTIPSLLIFQSSTSFFKGAAI